MRRLAIASVFLLGCGGAAPPLPARAPSAAQLAPSVPVEAPPAAPSHAAPILAARDPRVGSRPPRARALLVTEIKLVEQLAATASARAPDRAHLVQRLADDYAELARAVEDAPPATSRGDDVRAHRAAIKYYTELEGMPGYPRLDEAFYFEGLEREALGDLTGARHAYYALIEQTPDSKYFLHAYFGFGVLFDMQGWNESAISAYETVVQNVDSPLAPDAWIGIARAFERIGDPAAARDAYAHVLAEYPDSHAASAVPASVSALHVP